MYGHTSVGHSFMNPDVSEEASGNSPSWRQLYPYGSDLRAAWAEATAKLERCPAGHEAEVLRLRAEVEGVLAKPAAAAR